MENFLKQSWQTNRLDIPRAPYPQKYWGGSSAGSSGGSGSGGTGSGSTNYASNYRLQHLLAGEYSPTVSSEQAAVFSQDVASGSSANPQSLNRYIYALDNPNLYTDPTGAQNAPDYLGGGPMNDNGQLTQKQEETLEREEDLETHGVDSREATKLALKGIGWDQLQDMLHTHAGVDQLNALLGGTTEPTQFQSQYASIQAKKRLGAQLPTGSYQPSTQALNPQHNPTTNTQTHSTPSYYGSTSTSSPFSWVRSLLRHSSIANVVSLFQERERCTLTT